MSVSELLNSTKSWSDLKSKSISTKSVNLNDGPITNVSSINGVPIPPLVLDLNPVNIILHPGSTPTIGSNIVQSWSEVIVKASRINVNNCLNVYIDDSNGIVLIDQSYDCQGRVNFLSFHNTSLQSTIKIIDGVTISNPGFFSQIICVCESLTLPSLQLDSNSKFYLYNNSIIVNQGESTVFSIDIQDSYSVSILLSSGSRIYTQSGISFINVGIGSILTYIYITNTSGQVYTNDTISSTDNTALLIVCCDASVPQSTFVNSNFTGTTTFNVIDKSEGVEYDDTLENPQLSVINVQEAIDSLKSNYLNLSNIFGTTDQVNVSNVSGNITLSTPQNIDTAANVQFGTILSSSGLTLSNLTTNGVLGVNSSNVVTSSALTNGQLLIGNTGNQPTSSGITGTANQVNVSNGAGSITLSTPQNIDTSANVQFGTVISSSGLTLSNLTSNGVLGVNSSKLVTSSTLTNGQLLIGNTGNQPTSAEITGTTNQISVSNGAGSITLSTPQNINTGASPSFAGLTLSGVYSSTGQPCWQGVGGGSLQAITNNTDTAITFNWNSSTTLKNQGGITHTGGVWTVPNAGIYQYIIDTSWATNAVGVRQVWLLSNSRKYSLISAPAATGSYTQYTLSAIVVHAANDTSQVHCIQTSGGDLNFGAVAFGLVATVIQLF
jgi:hypothetical protein